MEIIRKTEIVVETKRRFIINRSSAAEYLICPDCPGRMMTAEAAAAVFNVSRRAVYRFIEQEKGHFSETEAGEIFICSDSFAEVLENI